MKSFLVVGVEVHGVRRSPSGERGLKYTARHPDIRPCMSLPIRGAWIEIRTRMRESSSSMSLPIRGAWIEICLAMSVLLACASLPIRGAWIEIINCNVVNPSRYGRSPSGERGLKCAWADTLKFVSTSLPIRGAWIEINPNDGFRRKSGKSLPIRGAWIEIWNPTRTCSTRTRSLPIRGAWIEMSMYAALSRTQDSRSPSGERGLKCHFRDAGHVEPVAPHPGSVD